METCCDVQRKIFGVITQAIDSYTESTGVSGQAFWKLTQDMLTKGMCNSNPDIDVRHEKPKDKWGGGI